jgi:glycosyltransferase involved in cell wall biosynthesis
MEEVFMIRVVLVNKFYYPRGGDCVAMLAAERLLRDRGHEVAVFSMQYPDNVCSSWDTYFPTEVSFSGTTVAGRIKAVERVFGAREVVTRFARLLNDFQPDVVHLHNIHSYLSPVVAQVAHRKGLRVVWTMHDYKLLCPTYSCLRNGKPCEECFHNKSKVVRHKCMKGSSVASLLAWMEACFWNREKLSDMTDLFISPSHFLKSKMTEGGFASEQIEVLHNFLPKALPVSTEKGDYYCYAGRLSEEKGIETLLEAAGQVTYPLKIIGGGPLLNTCRTKYTHKQIEFLGHVPPDELYPIVQKARFLVIPSVCYENNPYSVIEALCMGTPTLGARIGGIPELIQEGENGLLFTPGNIRELQEKINDSFIRYPDTYNFAKIAEDAQNKFGAESFYNKLMTIYDH